VTLLLDTQVLIWAVAVPDRLTDVSKAAMADIHNGLLFSVASWWEIAIKVRLGKLDLDADWSPALKREMRRIGVEWLPIRPQHCEAAAMLPFHHRDPFDRLLIAQAATEGLSVVTSDQRFTSYGIQVVW
jgi:PIN domain nuclease of toxin-antitoxin system